MSTLPTRTIGDTKYETPVKDLDEVVKALHAKKQEWAASTFAERRELCLKMVPLICAETETVAKLGAEYKGTYETKLGEEMVLWTIGEGFMWDIAETMKVLEEGKDPISRLKNFGPRADEGVIDVHPLNWFDPFLLPGSRGQIYLREGDTEPISGKAVRERRNGPGELCAILGAGNVSALNLGDVCNKVLLDGAVAVLKVNTVNEYTGPSVERALAPLIERGVLKVVYGGPVVGKALVDHKLVETVHVTGSDKTYDAIVWQGKKKSGTPPLKKPVSAELGCVSPVVVVPGEWSEEDLRHKALEVCRNVAGNASCNCLAMKVLVTSAAWPQREAFLEQLRAGFRSLDPRFVYYPGSREKLEKFQKAYPKAERLFKGDSLPEGCGPFVFNHSLSLDTCKADEHAFREEPWSTVLSEVSLPEADPADFLAAATRFCNERLWGTLSCTVMIHPTQEKTAARALTTFLREMRYGVIGVNTSAAMATTMPALSWGAYPGSTPEDIQSGVGVTRNSLCIENIEKSVVWASWGASKMGNSASLEMVCKGLNTFYRELREDGHPKWYNIIRMIFGILSGYYL